MSASRVKSVQSGGCLIASRNGDGEQLSGVLSELGINIAISGTGCEGLEAIDYFRPRVAIIVYHFDDPGDTEMFRRMLALCHQQHLAVVVIAADKQPQAVERLFQTSTNDRRLIRSGRCRVLANGFTDQLKSVVAELSNIQAASA